MSCIFGIACVLFPFNLFSVAISSDAQSSYVTKGIILLALILLNLNLLGDTFLKNDELYSNCDFEVLGNFVNHSLICAFKALGSFYHISKNVLFG